MRKLTSIRNSLQDIAFILAKDERIQRLLLVDQYYVDDQSFLFSLTKGRIFPAKKNCEVIRRSKELW